MLDNKLFNLPSIFLHLSGSNHSSSRQPRCPSAQPRPPALPEGSQCFSRPGGICNSTILLWVCPSAPPSWTGPTKMWPGHIQIRWPKHLNWPFSMEKQTSNTSFPILNVHAPLHPHGWTWTPCKGNIFWRLVLYLQPHTFGLFPELVTIGEGWNVVQLENQKLCHQNERCLY